MQRKQGRGSVTATMALDVFAPVACLRCEALIGRLELNNFKAFERFSVTFSGDAFLVGPNNAGKSTLIASLRVAANMVRIAKRNTASETVTIDGSKKAGHAFRGEQVGLIEENLRHEFHQVDTRMKVTFGGDARLEAVWPIDDDPAGYFIARSLDVTLRQPSEVRREFPEIALVPVLAPVEHAEELLSDKHVRANLDTRLASRHFRNQLHALRSQRSESHIDGLDEFLAFAQPWVPELELGELKLAMSGAGTGLDFYYQEIESRIPKEIFWAGDGMQIWLQLLLHVFRQKDVDVIVLDEPDVFLHADLQRRLVNLLESVPAQVISATHSADLLLEASEDSVIWVSRDRKRAVRAPGPNLQWEMSKTLGSAFNIPLARTLRAKCALFVEGEDMKILRILAGTIGAMRVAREAGVAVVPLQGFERWEHVEPFKWLLDNLLKGSVPAHVILDRDYRNKGVVEEIEDRLKAAGVHPHIWKRHELENYLLEPAAISRVAGVEAEWVRNALQSIVESMEDDFYSEVIADSTRRLRPKGKSDSTIAREAKQRADGIWADSATRLQACPGKELLSKLNGELQGAGHKAITARALARALRKSEIPAECRRVLHDVDQAAS